MNALEFSKTHSADLDWVVAMGNRECVVLTPGQRGTYAGYSATVKRHYHNDMYELQLVSGVTCVPGEDFKPN